MSSSNKYVSDDLGKLGPVYEISEKDMLDEIMNEVRKKHASGELDNLQRDALKMIEDTYSGKNNRLMPRAKKSRKLIYDPSITLLNDIKDANGRILFKAGTTKNPFDYVRYETTLCFIDGNDKDQIDWARNKCGLERNAKIILVSGHPGKASSAIGRRVYVDQNLMLSEKFKLEYMPAKVSPGGRVFHVEEVPL